MTRQATMPSLEGVSVPTQEILKLVGENAGTLARARLLERKGLIYCTLLTLGVIPPSRPRSLRSI
jgi:hypothetical protein